MMAHSHFRLSARRFILDLFDITFDADTFRQLDAIGRDMEERRAAAAFTTIQAPFEEVQQPPDGPHDQIPLVGSPELRQVATPPEPHGERRISAAVKAKENTKQQLEPAVVIKGFII